MFFLRLWVTSLLCVIYSAGVVFQELDRLALSAEERRQLGREMAARTGRWVQWDPHDFVAVQEEGLGQWGVASKVRT